jgi:hypothetical protein
VVVTEAPLTPNVVVGIVESMPFIARAVLDRAANPTEGGLYRNTEYTFFLMTHLTSATMEAVQNASTY